jgi:uncharacterized protein (DUF849 family)
VRVGLEDWPLGRRTTNSALVDEAVRLIAIAGGSLAGSADVRAACDAIDLAGAARRP